MVDHEPNTTRGEGHHRSASSTLRAILSQFALERTEGIPHAAVVSAMRSLGFSADAARQAISRASRGGALAAPPVSRRGEVLLSHEGREALSITEQNRMMGLSTPGWDGTWSLLIIRGKASLSQPHRVRNKLLLEGLGGLGNSLCPALWWLNRPSL